MKLVKYDKSGSGNVAGAAGAGSGRGSSSTTNISSGSVDLDRTIWGQYDDGDDIDGSMTVSGNIYVKVIEEEVYEPDDEDDDGEEIEEETGGGSLFVDENIEAKNIIADKDVTVGRHLYINYPTHPEHPESAKKCVGEILTDIRTDVALNKAEIGNLINRAKADEADIADNAAEIANLKSNNISADKVNEMLGKYALGSYDRPVVLFTGAIYRNIPATAWYIIGDKLNYNFTTSVNVTGGVMIIEVTPNEGFDVIIDSVNVNQEHALSRNDDENDEDEIRCEKDKIHILDVYRRSYTKVIYDDPDDSDNDINVTVNVIKIREYHLSGDEWVSDSWSSGDIQSLSLTIFGHIIPPETYN